MKKFTLFCAFLLALCLCGKVFAAVQTASMAQPYVFTDEQAIINCSGIVGPVAYSIRTFVATGWGPTAELTGDVTDGHLAIKPLAEGIHIVTLKLPTPLEVRFLAMTPPPSIDRAALLRAIPRHGKQLLDGQPCKLVTMGDSITTTGDYKTMLVLMLQRATGNKQITVVNRGRYGMTIDYNVRIMQTIEDDHPDIGLLMYGLNDQHALDPAAYLEQYRYVCDTLAKTCNTDMVILQPTPDFNIPLTAGDRNAGSNPDWYAFRGIGYAESLRTMATQMHLPLAETFQGIWGDGGKTMADAFRNNIAKFPLDASMQLTSILERDQHDGDHVHVNALGQLMIAHAAFAAISGEKVPAQPLTFSAVSEWTPSGLITNVTMRNTSTVAREGTIVAYPLLESAVTMDAPENYNLTPGQTATFTVRWPQLLKAEDLLKFPNDKYFLAMPPRLPLVDYSGNGSHVYAPAIPFAVTTTFVRERQVVSGSRVMVTLKTGNFSTQVPVVIPTGYDVGRIPLLKQIMEHGTNGYAAAELAYTRYGQALAGEARVDGNLDEWAGNTWVPVGEPFQARTNRDQQDYRDTPRECYTRWAFKRGKTGIYLAARVTGDEVQGDQFTIWFDPRSPQLLGTPGTFYWVTGSLNANGTVRLNSGETSARIPNMTGAWAVSADGLNLEIYLPYALFDATSWPVSGDLGVSIAWVHNGANGKQTTLNWSEDGFPWTPRWFGVVRDTADAKTLPYMVRIK